MREPSFDLRALFDRERIVEDVAGDLGSLEDHEFTRGDRSLDGAGKPGGFRLDRALDRAGFALDERGAGDIAFDRAIDMQICRSGDVAGDREVRSEDREGGIALAGHALASRITWYGRGWGSAGFLREHQERSPGKCAD
jgi:hypothetical protein